MAEVTLGKAVKAFLKVRDKRAALKREWEAQDGKLEEDMEVLNGFLLNEANKQNVNSFRTDFGTVVRELDITPTGSDWDAVYRWIAENDAFDILERRIKKTFVSQYMKDHKGGIPPGVSVFKRYKIVVRRSGSKENIDV
jgi:hypothetical protein